MYYNRGQVKRKHILSFLHILYLTHLTRSRGLRAMPPMEDVSRMQVSLERL